MLAKRVGIHAANKDFICTTFGLEKVGRDEEVVRRKVFKRNGLPCVSHESCQPSITSLPKVLFMIGGLIFPKTNYSSVFNGDVLVKEIPARCGFLTKTIIDDTKTFGAIYTDKNAR